MNDDEAAPRPRHRGSTLPALDAAPHLADALTLARQIDRLLAQLVDQIRWLEDHDVAGTTTGLDLDRWLASVAGRTRTDRRMLLRSAAWCGRLPALREAFVVQGTISWAQTRAIVCLVEQEAHGSDIEVDEAIGAVLLNADGAEPDDLLQAVRIALRDLRWREPTGDQPSSPTAGDIVPFVAMQPRLDGSGGQLYAELDALGFATVDAALTSPVPSGAGTCSATRPDQDGPTAAGHPPASRWVAGRANARSRARRLVGLCDAALTGATRPMLQGPTTQGPDPQGSRPHSLPAQDALPQGPMSRGPMTSRPQLLVRVDLATLLDRAQLPGALLTTLTGGALALDAPTLRQVVATRGADLRAIVLDDHGRVVGVGRRQRIAPGWLQDATAALHDTCSHPGCLRGVRACDTDHAGPWTPARPGDSPGRTDIDQLAPLCRFHNRTKEADGWRVTQDASGARRWTHPATGLATRTLPATWRPPPAAAPG